MNKKGQFYLIIAIIIIAIILGFAVTSNKSSIQGANIYSHIGSELKIESDYVFDYATYNELNSTSLFDLMLNFTRPYANYSQMDNSYYVFGNSTKIRVGGYRRYDSYAMFIDLGSSNDTISLPAGEYIYQDYNNPGNSITLITKESEYNLDLGAGKSFYFILSQEIGEEVHIITNF
ncbi:hypothetical protein ISS08_02740 [Candidatus Pacearchaeota archaeon]|nr:hypothetical protein [Candidatus Pacearchaeota archaeon]